MADEALQIHGGAGYMKEYEIERVARDLRLGPIGGGTDEIMKEILGQAAGALSRDALAPARPAAGSARPLGASRAKEPGITRNR